MRQNLLLKRRRENRIRFDQPHVRFQTVSLLVNAASNVQGIKWNQMSSIRGIRHTCECFILYTKVDFLKLFQIFWNSCRCADKILTQLEIHADAAIANNGTANRKMMASLKSDSVLLLQITLMQIHSLNYFFLRRPRGTQLFSVILLTVLMPTTHTCSPATLP